MIEHSSNEGFEPLSTDDTQPLHVPVRVEAGRSCRPALIRMTTPGIGRSVAIPPTSPSGLIVGRGGDCDVRVDDPTASRRHARIHVGPDGVARLSDLGSANGTLLNGRRVREAPLAEGDKIQVGREAVFRFALNDRLDEDYLEHLYQTSIRDPLTGLFNRRYLVECLERDVALAKRHAMPLSVILIDVDHFKQVNDTFGHSGGDRVLRALAELLDSMQRHESILARYGGEELAVLLRNVGAAGARVFAERMRAAVETTALPVGRGKVRVTISVGVASTSSVGADSTSSVGADATSSVGADSTSAESLDGPALIDRADRNLYLAKSQGRNRVV